jgi:cell division protein FtsB
MMTPAQEHNDDPQVAAFLAMVQTEARLRAEIAELRAECARLNLQVAEGDGQFCRDHNRISMLSLKVDELQAENRMLKEQLCSRDTAVDIEIEGELI